MGHRRSSGLEGVMDLDLRKVEDQEVLAQEDQEVPVAQEAVVWVDQVGLAREEIVPKRLRA